jgi:hypothetical protein
LFHPSTPKITLSAKPTLPTKKGRPAKPGPPSISFS